MTVTNLTPAAVSGTARVGQTLSVTDGTWDYDLDYLSYAYQWRRCDAVGGNCVDISGATSNRYVAQTADVGATLRARVTATEHANAPPPTPVSTLWGVNASKWYDASHNPSLVDNLGAKIVRHEESVSASASSLDAVMSRYRNVGIEVLLQVAIPNGGAPSTSAAQNCGAIASRHGPNGTDSIRWIEFGNETSYAYQLSGDPYPVGQAYARAAKAAAQSMAGTGVGLLVQIDSGLRGAAWANGMFNAVPDLASYVAGWTIHPYGPTWGPQRINQANSDLTAARDPSKKPYFFTEWGVASDNGSPLNDNYGWPTNMTYAQAAAAVTTAETDWATRIGSRQLALVIVYRDFDNAAPGASHDREAYFGVVKSNGQDKGAYTTVVKARLAS